MEKERSKWILVHLSIHFIMMPSITAYMLLILFAYDMYYIFFKESKWKVDIGDSFRWLFRKRFPPRHEEGKRNAAVTKVWTEKKLCFWDGNFYGMLEYRFKWYPNGKGEIDVARQRWDHWTKVSGKVKGNGNLEWKKRNLPLTGREATWRRWYQYRSTGNRTVDTFYYDSIWILNKVESEAISLLDDNTEW